MATLLVYNIAYAAIPVLALVVIAVALLVRARRRRAALLAAGGDPAPGADAARIIGVLAFIYGLAACFAVFSALIVTISMIVQSAQGGGSSAMTLPLSASSATAIPESVLPPFELDGQPIGSGYFSEISITAGDLSAGTELMYYAPFTLIPLLHAIVAFGIASLASRIETNEGFAPGLTRTAVIVGSSLIVIGTLSQALHTLGEGFARNELLGGTDLGGAVGPGPLDLTHVAAGVAVLLVGALMRRGERLQRDTAGLV